MVADGNWHNGDNFAMYRNFEWHVCTRNEHSIVGQLYFKRIRRKRDKICGFQRWGWGEGELDDGDQKVQTTLYNINKH